MSHNVSNAVAVIGIDIGKNSFHLVGLDDRGAVVLRRRGTPGTSGHRGACGECPLHP